MEITKRPWDVDVGKKWEGLGLLENSHNLPFQHEIAQVTTANLLYRPRHRRTRKKGDTKRGKAGTWSCMDSAWECRSSAEYLLFSLRWEGTRLICPVRSEGGEGGFPGEPSLKARASGTPPKRTRTQFRAAQEEDAHVTHPPEMLGHGPLSVGVVVLQSQDPRLRGGQQLAKCLGPIGV